MVQILNSSGLNMIIASFSVFACGLIAGQMLAIGLANYAALGLPEATWTLRFQSENALFTKTMPPSLVLPIIGLFASGLIEHSESKWIFAMACLLNLVVLGITMLANVPINNEIQSWTAGAAPETWTATRNRWLRFHVVRTSVGLAAFAVSVVGLASAAHSR